MGLCEEGVHGRLRIGRHRAQTAAARRILDRSKCNCARTGRDSTRRTSTGRAATPPPWDRSADRAATPHTAYLSSASSRLVPGWCPSSRTPRCRERRLPRRRGRSPTPTPRQRSQRRGRGVLLSAKTGAARWPESATDPRRAQLVVCQPWCWSARGCTLPTSSSTAYWSASKIEISTIASSWTR